MIIFFSQLSCELVDFGLETLSIVLTFVLFGQTGLVSWHLLVQLLDMQIKLLDLLSQGLLNWVGVQKSLDFLLTEQKFVFDQCLHVTITVDHSLQ